MGLAAGSLTLGLVASFQGAKLAATIATMAAAVLGPLGAVLLAGAWIKWLTILVIVVVFLLFAIAAVAKIIRQWGTITDLATPGPNKASTNKVLAKINGKASACSPVDSSAPSG